MTQNVTLAHQNSADNVIKNNDLLHYPALENLREIDGRLHVSDQWLCHRFGLDRDLLIRVLEDVEQDSPAVHHAGHIWIGDDVFYGICQHPYTDIYFGEAAQGAVLQLLGHYKYKSTLANRQHAATAFWAEGDA